MLAAKLSLFAPCHAERWLLRTRWVPALDRIHILGHPVLGMLGAKGSLFAPYRTERWYLRACWVAARPLRVHIDHSVLSVLDAELSLFAPCHAERWLLRARWVSASSPAANAHHSFPSMLRAELSSCAPCHTIGGDCKARRIVAQIGDIPHALLRVHAAELGLLGAFCTVRRSPRAVAMLASLAAHVRHPPLGVDATELSLLRAFHAVEPPAVAAGVAAPLVEDVIHPLPRVLFAILRSFRAHRSVRRTLLAPVLGALPVADIHGARPLGMPSAELGTRRAGVTVRRFFGTPFVAALLGHPWASYPLSPFCFVANFVRAERGAARGGRHDAGCCEKRDRCVDQKLNHVVLGSSSTSRTPRYNA